ncbi:hypothetical protein H257_07738 [Aphanomyces astaci]|uniref:Uncharacterized protein n=1 Tax=Aphanomyces astaci TaxID=112090 RepID=W4GI23_APHAT|nr:hypothetical protein H257_07738 [Aphanomyces astaci]ETV78951.1 hypothetical protein H257_07738 [Aphanomyces astaci]|eukprot:XP_009831670.1 hypothetical protein H257_07738 [Aphanomyces astaci]
MTSKDKIKCMHRHIPEHRNIRQLWGCIVNAAGELQAPVQSTRSTPSSPYMQKKKRMRSMTKTLTIHHAFHEDQVSAVEIDSIVPDDMSTEELAPSGTGSPATSGAAISSDVAGAEAVKEAVAKRGRRLGRMAKQLT